MATTPMATAKAADAVANSIVSSKAAAECHEMAAACHEQAAEQHRTAARLYAVGDHINARHHAKEAEKHGTQAQDHYTHAMRHSHLIEARYSGPDIVSPAVGHQPLGQISKM